MSLVCRSNNLVAPLKIISLRLHLAQLRLKRVNFVAEVPVGSLLFLSLLNKALDLGEDLLNIGLGGAGSILDEALLTSELCLDVLVADE